ncbi:ABC transporter permease [Nocardioides sp. GY 10127]|uniref:FtsX-like permease family protein n=1 Tax=Nocardioides sp. GY 10127 TaxID=2569762 RepID=UPI0010A933FB|nr:ABC transporter permease [Nocardioides sp. GY 10127]TIC82872.1 FtsX-like permease family protein [Nocardioides sp. GY 10127]
MSAVADGRGARPVVGRSSGRLRAARADWRLALRLGRRDAWRHRGRSLLVLVMVALPVAAVTLADTVFATQDVSGGEALERRLGTADALVTLEASATRAWQLPDPDDGSWTSSRRRMDAASMEDALAVLGPAASLGGTRPSTELEDGTLRVRTDDGLVYVWSTSADWSDHLTDGLATLEAGRLPATAQEAAISPGLAEAHGFAVGDTLAMRDGSTVTVVGLAEPSTQTAAGETLLLGPGAALPTYGTRSYLVGGGPVSWKDVLALNRIGVTAASRAVLVDPPSDSQLPPGVQRGQSGVSGSTLTVIVLVVVMVLLEVVLLAGPAFAVGARRQARTLALLAVAGGTPRQARRVVLGTAVVLGSVAAVGGALIGVLLTAAALPVLQLFSSQRFGPFQVEPLHLLPVALFGLLSAVLAAVVPAWSASRASTVAVLGGRRGDVRTGRRAPLVGALLLAAGVGAAALGASRGSDGGEVPIAFCAVLTVLGMVLLVPLVVGLVARGARRLPLPLRFAVRDAARHRTRTAPAVAAVAATVAGVVTLGIAVTSDEAENRAGYAPQLAIGAMAVRGSSASTDWDALAAAVSDAAPDASVVRVLGPVGSFRGTTDLDVRMPGTGRVLSGYSSVFGGIVVADQVPAGLLELDDATLADADAALAEGGLLALTDAGVVPTADAARLTARSFARDDRGVLGRTTVPAAWSTFTGDYAPAQGVLSPEAAAALGLRTTTVGLLVTGDLAADADRVEEVVGGVDADATVVYEQGYRMPRETVIVQLVLAALGAVLMLGGTLTATFLALSDARPDLATLSAVGAAPRTRRAVAAGYALMIGLVGAVLGAVVGLVPGWAITFPLTSPSSYQLYGQAAEEPSHYFEVPWLLLGGVVLGLPLLVAGVVWLSARSRLPLVARLE